MQELNLFRKVGTGAVMGATFGSILGLLGYAITKKKSNCLGLGTEIKNIEIDGTLYELLERMGQFKTEENTTLIFGLIGQCDLLCGLHTLACTDGKKHYYASKAHYYLYNIRSYLRGIQNLIPSHCLSTINDFKEVEKDLLKICIDFKHNIQIEQL